ncbi:hypothetical protein [Pseudomonas sp. HLS-6 TE3448]|jgi:hypothetical protein
MKKIVATALLTSIFASAYANENYDLECTLDTGEVMTLSHVSDTVYIEFLGADDDPDEGGSVIKLDAPSGGAQQILNNAGGVQSFVLRGTDADIDGAIAVVYETREGKQGAYFSLMDQMGKETGSHTCKPESIKASRTLLMAGLSGLKSPLDNNLANTVAEKPKAETSPVKINVDERLFKYGAVRTPYRTVNIVSVADDLTINGVIVNRNQCTESMANPKKPVSLPFGKTITYSYNIEYRRCDVVEVVVDTSKGTWTFNP